MEAVVFDWLPFEVLPRMRVHHPSHGFHTLAASEYRDWIAWLSIVFVIRYWSYQFRRSPRLCSQESSVSPLGNFLKSLSCFYEKARPSLMELVVVGRNLLL